MTHVPQAAAPAGALDADEADRLAEAFQPTWEAEAEPLDAAPVAPITAAPTPLQPVAEAATPAQPPETAPTPAPAPALASTVVMAPAPAVEESMATTVSMPPAELLRQATAVEAAPEALPAEPHQSLSKTVLGGIIPPEARAASVDVTAMYMPASPVAPAPPQTTRMLPSSAPPPRVAATPFAQAGADSTPSFDDLAFKPKPASRAWMGVAAVVTIGALAAGAAFLRGSSSTEGDKGVAVAPPPPSAPSAAEANREPIPPPEPPEEPPASTAVAKADPEPPAARAAAQPANAAAATPQGAPAAKAVTPPRSEPQKAQASTATTRPHAHSAPPAKGGTASKSSSGGIVRDNPF